MNRIMTPEATAQLQEGINLLLSRWAALRMAVANEWGGRYSLQKSQELGQELFNRLAQSREQVYIDDLEDILDEFMLSLNTEIGDGSIEEIAEKMMIMHEECLEGNFDSIMKLRETNAPNISFNRQHGSTDEDDSGDDGEDDMDGEKSTGMEVETPQGQLSHKQNGEPSVREVAEVADGWTVVAPRRNRGRRN